MADEPKFDNWKDAWEWHAQQAAQAFKELSENELIKYAEAGQYDMYYTLWDGFRKNGTLARSGQVLISVLRRETDKSMELIRYHCAGALFHLLGFPDEPLPKLRTRVQWGHDGEEARQSALNELEAMVNERIKQYGAKQ